MEESAVVDGLKSAIQKETKLGITCAFSLTLENGDLVLDDTEKLIADLQIAPGADL